MYKNYYCGRSKTGLPTVSENGGGQTNTGAAEIVCGPDGEMVKPLFVPRGQSNGEHAIFVAHPGIHVVSCDYSRTSERVVVEKIITIGDDDVIQTQVVGEWENGDGNIPGKFKSAVEAAKQKAHDYHCRQKYYSL